MHTIKVVFEFYHTLSKEALFHLHFQSISNIFSNNITKQLKYLYNASDYLNLISTSFYYLEQNNVVNYSFGKNTCSF